MRYNFNTDATQKRLATYSSDKSTFASVAGTIRLSWQPIEPSFKTEQLQIVGQAYEGVTDGRTKDIQVNDILTINSVEYKVKGVARYNFGGIDLLKCLCEISVTS